MLNNENPRIKRDGTFQPPLLGRVASTKEILFQEDGENFVHRLPVVRTESNVCPIDQDLTVDDFCLKRQLEFGNDLKRMQMDTRSSFDRVDITIGNLHLLDLPEMRKPADESVDPPVVTPEPQVESVEPQTE